MDAEPEFRGGLHNTRRGSRIGVRHRRISTRPACVRDKSRREGDLSPKEGVTSSDQIAWSQQRGGVYLPSPLVYGDHLYTVNNNGILTAYEAKTGKRICEQRVRSGGSFTASPVAAGERIYITSEDGDVFVVKAGPQYELLAKNSVGEPVLAAPAISSETMFIRGAKNIFAFKTAQVPIPVR